MESEWNTARASGSSLVGTAGMGVLRITLLFGSAAIALALIIAPIAENHTKPAFTASAPVQLDRMTTSSTSYRGGYTIRRSVLQNTPQSVCIIRDNGTRAGDCR